jgi:hypothetical protein
MTIALGFFQNFLIKWCSIPILLLLADDATMPGGLQRAFTCFDQCSEMRNSWESFLLIYLWEKELKSVLWFDIFLYRKKRGNKDNTWKKKEGEHCFDQVQVGLRFDSILNCLHLLLSVLIKLAQSMTFYIVNDFSSALYYSDIIYLVALQQYEG